MSRRINIISFIVTMAVTLVTFFLAVYVCNVRYSETMLDAMVKFLVGAIIAGFVHTFLHELGHFFAGKFNGFVFSSMTVWFFKWYRFNKKINFKLVMMGEEAGYTEMIPTKTENMGARLKKMALGGPIASCIFSVVGLAPFFITAIAPWTFCILSMFLTVGVYTCLGAWLPASSYGVRNDGAVAYGIKHDDDVSKVSVNLLKIQAEMYNGKTPAEVEESLYFDLPQLPEDDVNFLMLLNARYLYYLDKEDFENAKAVTERLISIIDDIPKGYESAIMVDALYNACAFDFNEQKADEITEDYEKFLNNVNTVTNVRAKLAYLLYVKGETEAFDIFYKKGVKEANRCQIKGLGLFEKKLFDKMKVDFEKAENVISENN